MTPDLDRWLEQATRRLSKDSAAQVRAEIQEHYQSAREAALSGGASQDEANRMALIALGDAKTANKHYLRVLLTASESGTLSKTWSLLALCGILDAMYASLYLLLMNPLLISRTIGSSSDAGWDLGLFALLAGACAIAADVWCTGKDHSWLLLLHGLALGWFGAIVVSLGRSPRPLGFRSVSLLFAVMAATIGAFALQTARAQRRNTRSRWFPIAAGTVLIAFAFSFIIVGFLIRLEPSIFFIWMSSYFVLCAIFMLWLAFRAHSRGAGQSGQADPFLPAPSPIHTH
jgi:uncharacterized membrane protein HdeD (DUF308 family)